MFNQFTVTFHFSFSFSFVFVCFFTFSRSTLLCFRCSIHWIINLFNGFWMVCFSVITFHIVEYAHKIENTKIVNEKWVEEKLVVEKFAYFGHTFHSIFFCSSVALNIFCLWFFFTWFSLLFAFNLTSIVSCSSFLCANHFSSVFFGYFLFLAITWFQFFTEHRSCYEWKIRKVLVFRSMVATSSAISAVSVTAWSNVQFHCSFFSLLLFFLCDPFTQKLSSLFFSDRLIFFAIFLSLFPCRF